MNEKKRGFVLFFLARSGSTYVITQLKNHPQIVARAEVFGNTQLPGGLEQTADNQIRFFRKFFRAYKKDLALQPEAARGFKIQPDQIRSFARLAKVMGEYDVAPLFLHRRNKVKQLISSYRAKQVKEFTEKSMGEARAHMYRENRQLQEYDFPKLHLDPMQFKRRLVQLRKIEHQFTRMKEKTGSALDLYYEDMMADKTSFFEAICKTIGVDPALMPQEDKVLKITQEDLREVIENFDEVLEVLRGTEFEAQLLEGSR